MGNINLKPISPPSWRFRGDTGALNSLWMSSSSAAIFIDGASKGNPGVSGAGGLVISSDGLSSIKFYWGLDIMSNNQVEFYSLLQASQLAKNKGYKSVQIFGDSKILIKALNSSNSLKKFALIVTL